MRGGRSRSDVPRGGRALLGAGRQPEPRSAAGGRSSAALAPVRPRRRLRPSVPTGPRGLRVGIAAVSSPASTAAC